MKRSGLPVTALLLAGATTPLAAQTVPPPPVRVTPAPPTAQPVWREAEQSQSFFMRDYDSRYEVDGQGRSWMRRPHMLTDGNLLREPEIPPELLAMMPPRRVSINLVVELDATGRASACRLAPPPPNPRAAPEEPPSAELVERVCALGLERLHFHAALNQDGQGEATPVAMRVSIGRNALPTIPPPAPPAMQAPRASWVVPEGAWVRRNFAAANNRLTLIPPPGQQFLARDRDRPRRADVGVLVTVEQDGRISACRVVQSSGTPAFDDASCAAMLASRNTGPAPSRYGNAEVPVLVRWDGRDLEVVPAINFVGPELVEQVVVTPVPANPGDPTMLVTGVVLAVAADGTWQSCQLSRPSYNDAIDAASCALFPPTTRFTAPRGVFGEPVAGRIELLINWRAGMIVRSGI